MGVGRTYEVHARTDIHNCAHEYYLPVSSESKSRLRQMGRLTSGCERLRASSLQFLLLQFLRTITSLHGYGGRERERARGVSQNAHSNEHRDRKRETKILINRSSRDRCITYFVRILLSKLFTSVRTVWRNGARQIRAHEVLSDNLSLNQRARLRKSHKRKER